MAARRNSRWLLPRIRGTGRLVCVLLAAALLAACAYGLSRNAKSRVSFTGSVEDFQQSPDSAMGSVVLWGGSIIETVSKADSTDLFVLQFPLGYGDRPEPSDTYLGRFIVRSEEFLDPELFRKGLLIALVGEIEKAEVLKIGEMDYLYPVLRPVDMKVWEPERTTRGPVFHFGFGLGARF